MTMIQNWQKNRVVHFFLALFLLCNMLFVPAKAVQTKKGCSDGFTEMGYYDQMKDDWCVDVYGHDGGVQPNETYNVLISRYSLVSGQGHMAARGYTVQEDGMVHFEGTVMLNIPSWVTAADGADCLGFMMIERRSNTVIYPGMNRRAGDFAILSNEDTKRQISFSGSFEARAGDEILFISKNLLENGHPYLDTNIALTEQTGAGFDSYRDFSSQQTDSNRCYYIRTQDFVPPPPIIAGDANGDGEVNAPDLVATRKQLLGLSGLTHRFFEGADTNGNGSVSITDLILTKKLLTGTWNQMDEHRDFSTKIKNGVLNLLECGAIPNSHIDHGPLIRSAIETVVSNPGTVLSFAPGWYRVAPISEQDEFVFDCAGMNADGLTIQGNGAQLILTDNFSGAFRFAGSENIHIEGLSFDYESVPWVQGEITAIDVQTQEMTVLLNDDNPLMDDPRYFSFQDTIFGTVRDNSNPKLLKKDCLNFFRYASHQKLGDRVYRIKLTAMTPFLGTTMVVGDKFTLNNRGIANASIFDIKTCGTVTLRDINVYASNGCPVLGQFQTGTVTIDNFNVNFKPTGKRWITTNSDGVHIQSGTHPVYVTNSHFEGLTDDGISLYQAYSCILNVISDSQIEVVGTGGGIYIPAAGTVIDVMDARAGRMVGSARVTGVQLLNHGTHGILTLETPIPGMTAGAEKESGDIVFVRDYMFPGSEITNTTYKNIRGRAVLIRSVDALIEDCTFENISANAVHTHFWGAEGSRSINLTIRGNRMKNVNYNWVNQNIDNAAAINIRMESYDTVTQGTGTVHENIVIENNIFTDYHSRAIIGSNVKGLDICGNIFTIDTVSGLYTKNEAIYINIAEDVVIEGNRFDDFRGGVYGIRYQGGSVSNIQIAPTNVYAMPSGNRVMID